MSTPFKFEEDKNSVFYHDLRVFIAGADVTPWVTGSLTINRADVNGTNSCSFSLANVHQAFELTELNLSTEGNKPKFRTSDPYAPDGRYSELAKSSIYSLKQKNNVQHRVKSFGPESSGSLGHFLKGKASQRDSSSASSTVTDRYPFTVGSLVFHKYDPVRVFVLDPSDRTGQQWVCEFTGYIDTKPYSQNYVQGSSFINVTAQDIRMLMRVMRTQANPSLLVGNQNTLVARKPVDDDANAGFFNDLVSPSVQISHVLGGLTWKQSIDFLIFGQNAGARGVAASTAGNTNEKTSLGKVGNLQVGKTVSYKPGDEKAQATLEEWNNLIIFGTNKKYLTQVEMLKMGAQTYIGGTASPDNQFVHYLVPDSGAPNNNLISYSRDAQVATKIDWTSRLELLVQMCKSVDYQFYVTGIGDIVFEFPMYDFLPVHYGPEYNKLYTFEKHLIDDSINDEGGEPISGLIITSQFQDAEKNNNNPNQGDNNVGGTANATQLIRTIFSNVLASRIGIHMETYSVPGVTNQDRLTQLGMIEFAKRVANFDRFEMTTSYRPYISVNRPIYHQIKRRMGISQTVSYSWNIREEVTLKMGLNFTRKQEKDGRFRFITGGEAHPISYNTIYDGPFVKGQGANSSGTTTNGPKNGGGSNTGSNL